MTVKCGRWRGGRAGLPALCSCSLAVGRPPPLARARSNTCDLTSPHSQVPWFEGLTTLRRSAGSLVAGGLVLQPINSIILQQLLVCPMWVTPAPCSFLPPDTCSPPPARRLVALDQPAASAQPAPSHWSPPGLATCEQPRPLQLIIFNRGFASQFLPVVA